MFTVWGVTLKRRLVAYPNRDGSVDFNLAQDNMTRAEWDEFKSQVEELYDIAKLGDSE